MATQPTVGAGNNFISIFENILGSVAQTASTIGTQVLPVWVANQLELEKKDGLFQPINDARFRPPTIESFANPNGNPTIQNVGGITGSKAADIALIGGVLVIGVIIALKA